MAKLRPMPSPAVPLVKTDGTMTETWLLYFRSREQIGTANLSDVSSTAPADTEVLIFNATTGKYEPGSN